MKKQLLVLLVLFAPSAFAQTPKGIPVCRNNKGEAIIAFDNQKVIGLKVSTPNLYKEQVFVKVHLVSYMGVESSNYGKRVRFVVGLAGSTEDVAHENIIEVSHSMDQYASPTEADLNAGPIYMCGEYSTTDINKQPRITNFKPSATGAMIHWTHLANGNINSIPKHPHGWIFANGKLFGTYNGRR